MQEKRRSEKRSETTDDELVFGRPGPERLALAQLLCWTRRVEGQAAAVALSFSLESIQRPAASSPHFKDIVDTNVSASGL